MNNWTRKHFIKLASICVAACRTMTLFIFIPIANVSGVNSRSNPDPGHFYTDIFHFIQKSLSARLAQNVGESKSAFFS